MAAKIIFVTQHLTAGWNRIY